MEVDEKGYSPDLWRKMAEQGWFGLIIPEAYGGVGMTFMDLIVLVEEFGRSLVPGPALPTIVSSIALLDAANEEQKQAYLPAIAAGERVWTLAFTEPSARFDADGVALQASRDGDACVLNGVKLFVRDSHVADNIVVVARTGGNGEAGVSLFTVDSRSEGIRHNPIATISSDKLTEIRFENVQVPSQNMLGQEGKAWPVFKRIANKATVLEAAYLVGLAQMDFDITLDYTKDRIQFGRPVATFQALQHKAADMATDVDGSRYITYKAAWAVANEEADAEEQVHIAKAWASDASRRVVAQAQQMHGGIGFTKDYRIQLYFRRQKSAEVAWGDADHHREALARALGI